MHALLLAALTAAPAQPPTDAHDGQNPLFKRLTETGLDIGGGATAKFPAPTMADGLSGAKQKEIIKGLIGNDYSYDEFARDSLVAPQLLRIRDVKPGDPKAPARGVDVWFIAYGDFKRLQDDKFLDRLMNAGKSSGGGKGGPLKPEDLAKRKIEVKKGDEKREGYGTFEFDFLEKVRLTGTGHAVWSRNADSMVAAAEIDPRFAGDKEFPNQWRALGGDKPGPANPWGGAAMYLKITKLAEPAGAVFVEQHVIFAEPTGWFDGANLLRSKLPIAMQQNVRNMRQEFRKK
ncbi:hypothetical protein GobsT_57480 [Gemmata obscuriglobus]|uniref:Uncharacterized protein n=1 Tax=Gemmata obscuriglobus TaxID=114 RepID=A0A2Z3GT52_9BACT|nr:hypothetical protein [Gemmata obscuriglobus]AWM36448.1 hypothetical protein C1280_05045 [Gemmata obscuriglobus]QEG30930.1 hypothetical protein GobsT_57480 [Gemmata obscuriglobus]VTS10263.1 Uncharacterized protein OS=Isosphaera pallida (strain ATCC 43644 / DSM 9630 / IS1B) GN=Isop_3142 PE=4 SV=1 [Gemmata obscuriglobus UQM 2246]